MAICLHAGVSRFGMTLKRTLTVPVLDFPSSTTNPTESGSGPSVDTHSSNIDLLFRKRDLQKLPRNHKLEIRNHVLITNITILQST